MSQSVKATARRIVVGVDGSPSSVAALRWAIAEATVTGDTVEALMAWQYPISADGYGWAPVFIDERMNLKAYAEKTLSEAIDRAIGPDCPFAVERRVVEGYASSELVAESAHADLLVVGSRGHGTFADALIGSTSQNCAHHAKCPVVIVRGEG
jgi:nucleotide-binding universal stress UspA family protein